MLAIAHFRVVELDQLTDGHIVSPSKEDAVKSTEPKLSPETVIETPADDGTFCELCRDTTGPSNENAPSCVPATAPTVKCHALLAISGRGRAH